MIGLEVTGVDDRASVGHVSSCVQHTTLSRSRIRQLAVVPRTKSQPEGAEKIVWIILRGMICVESCRITPLRVIKSNYTKSDRLRLGFLVCRHP